MSRKKEKVQLKGDALVNKVALIVIEVIFIALIFGYVSDYVTGTATIASFLALEVTAIPSFFILLIVYKKKPLVMRYVAFICFAIVYAIGCFGAHIDSAFAMLFPMAVVFILYYDGRLISIMTLTFGAISIADVCYVVFGLKTQHSGNPLNSSMIIMQVASIFIFLIAICVTTSITKQNNEEKLNTIRDAADRVNASIQTINGEIENVTQSSDAVKQAMEEINSGVSNTAEAVQNQLEQTEEIQAKIESVQSAAQNISENVSTTMSAVEEGNRDVESLVGQADTSVSISNRVIKDLNTLKENVDAMGSITKMIENIAFQTNIMALNANVEAAHAGDAGKGFAVVASEISNMSAKTKDATDNISEMIENATASLNELVASVSEMTEVITSEKEQTAQTSEIFSSIQSSTVEVQETMSMFLETIGSLNDANREIVNSVSTISAVTEEVTALTNEAMNMETTNAEAVENIARQMEELAGENA